MATIGQTLSAARIAAGCSLEHLSTSTRIRMQVLKGIENEDFVPCGGDFYARGHIRRICKFLGLDPRSLLEEYDREHASDDKPLFVPPQWHPATESKAARVAAARGEQEASQDVPRRVGDEDLDPTQRAENWGHFERNKKLARVTRPTDRSGRHAEVPPPRSSEGDETEEATDGATAPAPRTRNTAAGARPAGGVRRHWPWAVVGLILITALIVGVRAWNGWEEGDPSRTAFETSRDEDSGGEETVDSGIVPDDKEIAAKAKAQAQVPEKATEPVDFTVRLTGSGRSWVEVTDDEGADLFTGFIVEGETLDYVTEGPLTFRLGKPGSVGVAVDGEDLGTEGKSRGVEDFTVGADGFAD